VRWRRPIRQSARRFCRARAAGPGSGASEWRGCCGSRAWSGASGHAGMAGPARNAGVQGPHARRLLAGKPASAGVSRKLRPRPAPQQPLHSLAQSWSPPHAPCRNAGAPAGSVFSAHPRTTPARSPGRWLTSRTHGLNHTKRDARQSPLEIYAGGRPAPGHRPSATDGACASKIMRSEQRCPQRARNGAQC